MIALLSLFELLNCTAFFLTVALNGLVIMLVVLNTNTSMRPYSRFLIVASMVDLIAALTFFYGQMNLEANRGFLYARSSASWNANFMGKTKCLFPQIESIPYTLSFWSIPIQGLFCHRRLCQKQEMPFSTSLWIYSVVLLAMLIVSVGYFVSLTPIAWHPLSPAAEALRQLPFWNSKRELIASFCFTKADAPGVLIFAFVMDAVIIAGLFVTIFTAVRIRRFLENSQNHFTARTLELQRQLTTRLFGQALLPVLAALLTIVISVTALTMSDYHGGLFVVFMMPYPWVLVINPALTIFCIKSYRHRIVRFINLSHRQHGGASYTSMNSFTCWPKTTIMP